MRNVLFLGGGRRVELANMFIDHGYRIFAYETSFKVPLIKNSVLIEGMKWKDSGIEDHIDKTVIDFDIDLVVPLQDEAVVVLSKMGPDMSQLCSSYYTALTCFDKSRFDTFMRENFIDNYPYDNGNPDKIFKGRFGFGSNSIYTRETFVNAPSIEGGYITQRKIKGIEYSVDSFFVNGNHIDSVPRRRLRTAGGEVISSRTEKNSALVRLTKEIGEELVIHGPANFQYIVEEVSGIPYLFEINCRFGGGYTLSIHAGLDVFNFLGRYWFGEKLPRYTPGSWRIVQLERSYRDHYFEVKE